MAAKRFSTGYPGVRYREHPTRKHGVKRDRYFFVYYRLNGKKVEEGLGWASKGMTAEKAAGELAKLKETQRLGQQGPQTLKEKRSAEKDRREQEVKRKEEARKDALTFGQVFDGAYIEEADRTKDRASCKRERELCRLYIASIIGDVPIKSVTINDVETIKARMLDAKRAPATIRYALAVVRQVINYAKDHGLFEGENPVSRVKKPAGDNQRVRFLTHEEADELLEALRQHSVEVHNMALLSLHTGMRAGEVFGLTWGDVDFKGRMLCLKDTKSGYTRFAHMTDQVVEMLFALPKGQANELVFPARGKSRMTRISATFIRVVDALKLNEGIADPRQEIVFHTLRHTYASWLIAAGCSIYTVKKLLGHRTLAMTERYSHLADETLKDAVRALQKDMARKARGRQEAE